MINAFEKKKSVASKVKSISSNKGSIVLQKVNDYLELVKIRLSLTVVFSAILAFLIACTGDINWFDVGILAFGGLLITGSANALNQVLEKEYDLLMKRTQNRPVATGRMSVSEAVMAAGLMGLTGIIFLASFNPWTALFGMMALLSYAFLYTPMKRVSTAAIAIGAFPGALPVLIGCVAFQGELTTLALGLFALQFLWQFPHFAAIGWLGYEDYKKAGYQFVSGQDKRVGLQSMIYALFLIPVGLIPYYSGLTGIGSSMVVTILAIVYAWFGLNLYRKNTRKSALQLMFSSFFYLPLTLIILFFDKI
ncbi:MAG: heme o synthase [Bacteroidetes bacterium]|jgi:protoheme IX farnesyltransferase|nr:heme o synthase [Bacteroidota bacterium]